MTNSHPTLADVKALLPNVVLLPIDTATKRPFIGKGWQKTTFAQTQTEGYQRMLGWADTVGILLGSPSGCLAHLDCDSLPFFEDMQSLNPLFSTTLCTRGYRAGGFWFWMTGPFPNKLCPLSVTDGHRLGKGIPADPKTGRIHIGEFRGGHGQSVICGLHATGCHYTWPQPTAPIVTEFNFTWPNDLDLPWVKTSRAKATSSASNSQVPPNNDLLKRAIAALPIPKLWEYFGYPKAASNTTSSPFRKDNNPSFSIFDNDTKWKDHAIGETGDSYDFYQKGTGKDAKSAFRDFVTLAGLGSELGKKSRDSRPTIRHPGGNRYIGEFAADLGPILKPHGFYRFHGRLVQVREVMEKSRSGKEYLVKKMVEITTLLFSILIEDYCRPFIKKGKLLSAESIAFEVAQRTLIYPKFLECFPEIKLWTDCRIPVWSGNQIILSQPGYDLDTGVYTSPDTPIIDESLTVDQAVTKWRLLLVEFCFPRSGVSEQDEPDERLREPERERCISISLAAAITPFCFQLFPEKAKRPGFAASANAEGAGKTLLLSIGMVAKLGYVPVGAAPDQEEEMRKVLDAAVHFGVPILFFDNLKGHLSSGQLEGFITASKRQYRLLGTTNSCEAENISTVYVTANFATYSSDLRRRLLSVELILEQARAEERVIQNYLDEEKLIKMRPELLSIFWAFVKEWDKDGQPAGSASIPSFEDWSRIIGGIVESAGFTSPCQLASMQTGGDTDTRDMEKLVMEMNPAGAFRFTDLVSLASDHHLFARLIPVSGGMERKQAVTLGKILRRFVGRVFASRYRFCLSDGTRYTERYRVEDLRPDNPF